MTPTGKIGLGTSLALLSGGIAQAAKPATGTTPKKPNIVLVIADDCRFLDLGCYGSPDAITPNIDRLAAEGVRFTRFFQATAMSSATRHCLGSRDFTPIRSAHTPTTPGSTTVSARSLSTSSKRATASHWKENGTSLPSKPFRSNTSRTNSSAPSIPS